MNLRPVHRLRRRADLAVRVVDELHIGALVAEPPAQVQAQIAEDVVRDVDVQLLELAAQLLPRIVVGVVMDKEVNADAEHQHRERQQARIPQRQPQPDRH